LRALTIDAHGGLDQLRFRSDVPVPELGSDDEVRVRVHAAALNHLDLWVVEGVPGIRISAGWILGSDCAGVIEAVGSGVRSVRVGDRVVVNPGVSDRSCEYCLTGDNPLCLRYAILGEHRPGGMADLVVVPSVNVLTIPPQVSWSSAAAFPLATLTAWRMVVSRAQVGAGDEVLIQGIGGGVAQAALQIAKGRGARVWVTSGSDRKLARARELGADEGLNNRTTDVAREIRARTGKRGVDVVIDCVGEATWTSSLGALGKRGRLVTCGGTSGPMLQTDVRRMFWNQWTLMGSTMGSDTEFAAIVEELRAGRLHPPIDSEHPLEDARSAFERLQSGEQFGKVVVTVADQ
jgi:NADPH:quinone reductase-like Zn-dependent oxidoreductase